MSDFKPYITADGSTGLYNNEVQDIYHSASGALSEAFDKFIEPIDFDLLISKDNIKILDICYGIGYNSKAFLNLILEKYYKNFFQKFCNYFSAKINNLEPIYTNNHSVKNKENLLVNNYAIYTDNIFNKLTITTVDNDKILMAISPFIKTGINNPQKFNKGTITDKDYNKYYTKAVINKPRINNLINYFILTNMLQAFPNVYSAAGVSDLINNNSYSYIFNKQIKGIFSYLTNQGQLTGQNKHYLSNLHNIYYRYLSKRYKKALKCSKLDKVIFNPIIADARDFIKNDKNEYHLIFLDAFSPTKCPCLWTYDFFKCLYEHLDSDGMLLTYSTSASVRNAMMHAGFFVGNNIKNGKTIGTICAKNKTMIKHPLSEYEKGLLNTKAGIFYRDRNLTALNEAIIDEKNYEVKISDKISTTQYIKSFKNVK